MIKENRVELGSNTNGYENSSQQIWLPPCITVRDEENAQIEKPKGVTTDTGRLDQPLGAFMKEGIVFDGEIDGVFDEESRAVRIEGTRAWNNHHSKIHSQEARSTE